MYYSGSSTYLFGVGAVLCSNPSGLQTFHTVAYGTYWELGIPSKCGDFHYEEMPCQRYVGSMTRSSVRGLYGS